MTNETKPFSIRVKKAERALLERRAGKQAIGEFVPELIFGKPHPIAQFKNTPRPRTSTADQTNIAQALASLGKSNLAKNLNTLTGAARLGAMPVAQEPSGTVIIHRCDGCTRLVEPKKRAREYIKFLSRIFSRTLRKSGNKAFPTIEASLGECTKTVWQNYRSDQ